LPEFLVSADGLGALLTVIMIDVVMSGDNAVIIGMAAAGLPAALRRKAIIYGILFCASPSPP
jgi:predicted tellurium resistance membrane protein TerC